MREPPFWWRRPGLEASLLAPAAALYGAVAARRLARKGHRATVPVVCIGNPTVGGAGKTPLAIAVARMLAALGEHPVFLSRGYGGRSAGPLRVEPGRHGAADVGDEPLLLAGCAPTIVARDRVAGAEAAIAVGAGVVVMDDGFQNPSLIKDVAMLVVDARRGVGNGRVLPAGPLRAPLSAQLERAHALVVVGAGAAAADLLGEGAGPALPVFTAHLVPDLAAAGAFAGRRVLAFAGIGDPDKFFRTLAEIGADIVVRRRFPDHHRYTAGEAAELCENAERQGLVLVTTEKDLARLQGETTELARRARALPVTLVLDEEAAFRDFLVGKLRMGRAPGG